MTDGDDLKKRLARLNHLYGLEYEMIRPMAAFEHAALRPLFLLNGGALVAYLTLFGALGKDEFEFLFLALAVGGWVFGLCLATLAAFFAALSQFAFRKHRGTEVVLEEKLLNISRDPRSEEELNRGIGKHGGQADSYRCIAILVGLASLLFFVVALIPAFLAID
jgi:hypothetical protein